MEKQKETIFAYITEEQFKLGCKGLKDGDTKNIYKADGVEIELKKVGRKIFKFINHYGNEKLSDCICNMYMCRPKK